MTANRSIHQSGEIRISHGGTPEKPAFWGGHQTLQRDGHIAPLAVAALEHPGFGLARFGCLDIPRQQLPKALMVFPGQPVSELPEDQPIESAKNGRRVVGVLVERGQPGVADSNVPPYRGGSGCSPWIIDGPS